MKRPEGLTDAEFLEYLYKQYKTSHCRKRKVPDDFIYKFLMDIAGITDTDNTLLEKEMREYIHGKPKFILRNTHDRFV